MRYRPFGSSEMAVSVLSLALIDGPQQRDASKWRDLIFQAMEHGVNAFEICGRDPGIAEGLALALESVERHLLMIGLRLGPSASGGEDFSPEGLAGALDETLATIGIDRIDAMTLNDPAEDALSVESLEVLTNIRRKGKARYIGITGDSKATDYYIATGQFDMLTTPYSLLSGWATRNRLREALDRDMAIIGYGYYPAALAAGEKKSGLMPKRSFWGMGKAVEPDPDTGAYAFLHDGGSMSAEEICLIYALTQPALATMQATSEQIDKIAELAKAAERELPPGLAPRIEMARWGDVQVAAQA